MITGIMHLENAGFLSSLNNKVEYTVFDPGFTEGFYGFTIEELNYFEEDLHLDSSYRNLITEWYNGYLIGETAIYNPWSIVLCINKILELDLLKKKSDYIKEKAFSNFWCHTGRIQMLSKLFKYQNIKSIILDLINGDFYECSKLTIVKDDYSNLMNIAKSSHLMIEDPDQKFLDLFFTILSISGYLTVKNSNKNSYLLAAPNNEIKEEFSNNIIDYYKGQAINFKDASECLNNIICCDSNELELAILSFNHAFFKILNSCSEFMDIKDANNRTEGIHGNENVIHSLLNTIGLISKNLILGSEIWYKQKARCDLILISKKKKKV